MLISQMECVFVTTGAYTVKLPADSPTCVPNVSSATIPLPVAPIETTMLRPKHLPGPIPTPELPTPVRAKVLCNYLKGYDENIVQFLKEGFSQGFSIGYEGNRVPFCSPNLKSALEMPEVVDRKLAKELALGRIAGPFDEPPFQNFRTSPIGLQPKKTPGEFRVIHHLSYPQGSSINDGIPREKASVHYATIDDAIAKIKQVGQGCYLAKTDIESAFRLLPINPADYSLLGFKWKGKFYYDKCLPMGCSSSCSIFEKFSSALEWIACNKLNIPEAIHILDDFLFIVRTKPNCHASLNIFEAFCDESKIPLVVAKTVGPDTELPFAGVELDTVKSEARLPADKLNKCRMLLAGFLQCRKATLRQIQSLVGLLNFAATVVRPGRPFMRRLIDLTIGLRKPHHRRRITDQVKEDLTVWARFLNEYNGRSFFISDRFLSSATLHFFTDASTTRGFGAVFGSHWTFGPWLEEFQSYNIAVLEFYPIVLAIHLWGSEIRNRSVVCHTDNMSIMHVINNQTSKNPMLMNLLRRLVLKCLRLNVVLLAQHIPGLSNIQADLLSRLQIQKFKEASKGYGMDCRPTLVRDSMHHKIFFKPLRK